MGHAPPTLQPRRRHPHAGPAPRTADDTQASWIVSWGHHRVARCRGPSGARAQYTVTHAAIRLTPVTAHERHRGCGTQRNKASKALAGRETTPSTDSAVNADKMV